MNGTCTSCATDGECASGLCLVSQGVCASGIDVAYVSPGGSPTSDCTKSAPCTLLRSLALDPARGTIRLATGTYSNASTITVEGTRVFVGEGMDATKLTNTGSGPVFVVGSSGQVSFERVEIFGGKNGAQPGVGIQCSGLAKLRISDARLAANASDGLAAFCDVSVTRSQFRANGGFGARLDGSSVSTYVLERSTIASNTAGGVKATGRGTLRNNFIFKNTGPGLELGIEGFGTFATRPDVSFTTVAAQGSAINCLFINDSGQISITNSILDGFHSNPNIGLNKRVCAISTCAARQQLTDEPGCVQSFNLGFQNEAAEDFHLAPSFVNPAINGASGGSGLVDYDGEMRPIGAAADIGADECNTGTCL